LGARYNAKGERERERERKREREKEKRENMEIGEFINSFNMGEQADRLQIKD
jgi:ribosomal protein L21E